MEEQSSTTFGPFAFEAVSGSLTRAGQKIAISHRGASLLKALLQRPGAICSKADLLDAAWPNQSIEESNLSVQIASLRKALGNEKEWIETVPRIGYRFVGAIDNPRPPESSGNQVYRLPLLAVVSSGKQMSDEDYFGEGVIDDIAIALSRFKSFAVIARGSSAAYRNRDFDFAEIAAELGVQYLLTTSVRRSGNLLRIIAQLFDGGSGRQLWADHYDGELGNVFEFQDQITPSVASIIEPHIQKAELEAARRKPAGSVSTYDVFLQARALILAETEPGNAQAYDLLTQALKLEPDNGLLLSHAAWALEHRHTMGWRSFGPDDVEQCQGLAHRGIAHADGDATVLAACGMALLQTAKQYELGIAAIQAAVDSNPNHIAANICAGIAHLHCDDLQASEIYTDKAITLSPRDPHAHIPLCTKAHIKILLGEYGEAISLASRSLAKNPNFDPAYWILIAATAHLGQLRESGRYLEKLLQIAPGVTISKIRSGQPAKDPSRFQPVVEGLRAAGLQE